MHGIVLALHIAVGAAALLSFWTAALARKGSPTHRLAGRVYLLAMTGILVTALPLALAYFGRGQPLFGVFFLYLMLLVGGSVVVAPRAVRLKQDFEAFRGGIYPLLAWALIAGGAATAAIGLWSGQTLLLAFGLVGALRSVHMLRLRRLPAPPPGWWLREHFTAMIANGVATHIAFLGIGLARVLPPRILELHLSWFIPLAAGISAIAWLSRRHRRRFAGRPAALVPQAAASSTSS
jgi:hypothetical protein